MVDFKKGGASDCYAALLSFPLVSNRLTAITVDTQHVLQLRIAQFPLHPCTQYIHYPALHPPATVGWKHAKQHCQI